MIQHTIALGLLAAAVPVSNDIPVQPGKCPGAVVVGAGCGSGVAATRLGCTESWTAGGMVWTRIAHALPVVNGAFVVGLPDLPPIDLAAIGAAGCVLYTLPFATVPVVTDVAGESVLALPLGTALEGAQLVMQGVVMDPLANALGVATTNGLAVTVLPRA